MRKIATTLLLSNIDACRINLGYNKLVCDITLDKSELGIECDGFNFENTTLGATAADAALSFNSVGFNYTVCKAEVEAQKLANDVSGKRAPIAAIFPFIVLLFAGGFADRYNKRKPCMIMPIIGELLSFISSSFNFCGNLLRRTTNGIWCIL
ncbi:uncharacterized protein LOC105211319 [Zeugodacus cucurbitae]|uniref:uncharacterized protein LOC105211319 n=1 Tax=Zeugodacus cucurbitae TaxID=28588 RepID=UPI0010A74BA7|nr:uncharacterized protein LOC105211319 [Zeugodacus cucurbitae]